MSSENTDERVTALEGYYANIMARFDELERRKLEQTFSTPKSEEVNVLLSVSNPTSETSPLSAREHDLPPVPPVKSHTTSTRVKPANPSEFLGDHTKGRAFPQFVQPILRAHPKSIC
jgi:hypothetical protein